MKLLKQIIEDCDHLLFIDLEGTQFSHEVIAIGALIVDCDEKGAPVGEAKTFKCYVKAEASIGSVVTAMTGIDNEKLEKEGIPFQEAMAELNDFIGNKTNNLKVLTYGNQDKHMLSCSFRLVEKPTPFLTSFVNFLIRNNIDVGSFFSRYIRGKKNELVSLTHMREFFSIAPSGDAHDPLVDTIDLYHIYQAFSADKGRIISAYKKLLKNSNIVPQPIKTLICNLVKGQSVTPEDLDKLLEVYFD